MSSQYFVIVVCKVNFGKYSDRVVSQQDQAIRLIEITLENGLIASRRVDR